LPQLAIVLKSLLLPLVMSAKSIEKPPEEMQALLDTAFKEGIISGKRLETSLSDPTNLHL